MVFTQIFCQSADFQIEGGAAGFKPASYQLNCNGVKKVVLIGMSYVQTSGASVKAIGLKSNVLTVSRGQYPYLIFSSQQGNFVISPSTSQIEWNNVNLFGNIDIFFVDTATGAFPANFISCIIYLDIIDI